MTTRFRNYLTENGDPFANISHVLFKDCMQFLKEIKKAKKFLYRGTYKTGYHQDTRGIDEFYPREDRRPKDTAEWMHEILDDLFKKKFHWGVRSEGVFAAGTEYLETYGNTYLFFPVDGYKFVWSPDIGDLTSHLGDYTESGEGGPYDESISDDAYETYEEECGPGSGRGEWHGSDGTVYGTTKDLKKNKNIVWIDNGYDHNGHDYTKFYLNVRIKFMSIEVGEDEFDEELEWVAKEKYDAWSEDYYRRKQEEWYINANEESQNAVSGYTDKNLPTAIKTTHEISFKCKKYYLVNKNYQAELEQLIFHGDLPNRVGQKQTSFSFMKEAKKPYVSHLLPSPRDIGWEELEEELNKNCKQYKKEKLGLHLLYRGFQGNINKWVESRPRTDRTPIDMPIEYHKYLDDLFLKKFGWRARSSGLFVSGSIFVATSFAPDIKYVYIVVPHDGYEYIWSPEVDDLYGTIEQVHGSGNLWPKLNQEMKDELKELTSNYEKNNLKSAVDKGYEITIKCSSYYQINRNFTEKLHEWQIGK